MDNSKRTERIAIGFALLAAALYAINVPCSKALLTIASPTMMASFLYIGAGAGMGIMMLIRKMTKHKVKEKELTRADVPYTVAMVVLDIAAPILMMFGLKTANAANASLLNNFEIVATALIAMLFFHEKVGRLLWIAIAFVTTASVLLTLDGSGALSFNIGSLLVICATICWGLENNCTRQIANKDPMEIVTIKGFGSGLGALIIAMCIGEGFPPITAIVLITLLGYVSYGLSIYVYTYAQRGIGAARTSTYYAVSPFIGVILSIIFLGESITPMFCVSIILMAVGVWFATR